MTDKQKEYFDFIMAERGATGTLCNSDLPIIIKMAVAIDRLFYLEQTINQNPDAISMAASVKAKYDSDFYRGCNELGMSPQSRAKMSISAVQQSADKPSLMDLLKDDEDD